LFPKQLLGPVDVALWDIAAKAAGLPLYRFLGSFRDRVRAYAASLFLDSIEDLTKQAVEAQEAGFKAFKLHLWGDVDKDVRACKEVRSAVGEELELMVDLHGTYNRQQALAVGRHLEELRFVWYEEPIPDDDLEGYVQLTRDLEIPVAALQSLNSHLVPLGSYLTRGAVDIVLIDTSWKGGVTGVRKLAHTCEVLGTSYEICSSFNALMSVANLHTICSLRHGRYFEIMVPGGVFDFGLKTALDIDSEGYVQVPAGPGLGVELDEEYLNRYTVATL
jgi:L-alanine-DL-glutamate epimerase-like enolase superfamily enzyme